MTTRKLYDLFVDDVHIRQIRSGWPIGRIMAQLNKRYLDAKRLEVRLNEDRDMSVFLLRGRGRYGENVSI